MERGLAQTRSRAQALVLAGAVQVNGEVVRAAACPVSPSDAVSLSPRRESVSRAAGKLAPALEYFGVDPSGRVCADAGASTGGFTEVLLRGGALRVYAIDVGWGQLDWTLRQDPRVVVMDRTNARLLERLPEPVHLVTLDLSFISLRLVLPAVRGWLHEEADVIALFKPQFEVGREQVGSGGIVRDAGARAAALGLFEAWCAQNGYVVLAQIDASVTGRHGNQETLMHLRRADT